jgi:glycosyltransferase involved in cell wall biosynthesis
MNLIYLGGTNIGGTYRVFLTLQRGLRERGVNLVLESGTDLIAAADQKTIQCAAGQLIDRLARADGIIVNVFTSTALMNLVRYLPPSLPRVMVVHSITHATLQAARALRDYVHATIGVSPRIKNDLLYRFGFDQETTHSIFNALDPSSVADPSIPRSSTAVLSLGRLEEGSKGILQLPKIFDTVVARRATLTIGGDGPDRERLQNAFLKCGVHPIWLGQVPLNEVAEVYARHSIFLFPSHFEGMGLALAEAMASGLVPVATRIHGVTDVIIEDGVSGFLFNRGDLEKARTHLQSLLGDHEKLNRVRAEACKRAKALFGVSDMSDAYIGVFRRIIDTPFAVQSESLENWSIPHRMRPGLRALIPAKMRRRIANALLGVQ